MPGQKQVGPAPGQIEAEPGQGKWTEVEGPVAPVPGSLPQPQRAAGFGGGRLEAASDSSSVVLLVDGGGFGRVKVWQGLLLVGL